jgi:hypothetical protein
MTEFSVYALQHEKDNYKQYRSLLLSNHETAQWLNVFHERFLQHQEKKD